MRRHLNNYCQIRYQTRRSWLIIRVDAGIEYNSIVSVCIRPTEALILLLESSGKSWCHRIRAISHKGSALIKDMFQTIGCSRHDCASSGSADNFHLEIDEFQCNQHLLTDVHVRGAAFGFSDQLLVLLCLLHWLPVEFRLGSFRPVKSLPQDFYLTSTSSARIFIWH